MKKITSLIVTGLLVIVLAVIFMNRSPSDGSPGTSNVAIKNGVQYVTVNAKGGYSPKTSTIKAGIPTKLIVKTDNTYDCSSSLVVQSVNYRSMLAATGETEVDLGTPKSGEKIQ